jgi:hypothetical protein
MECDERLGGGRRSATVVSFGRPTTVPENDASEHEERESRPNLRRMGGRFNSRSFARNRGRDPVRSLMYPRRLSMVDMAKAKKQSKGKKKK